MSSVTLIGIIAILFSTVCALGYSTQADAATYFIDQQQVIHDQAPGIPGSTETPEITSNSLPEIARVNWFNSSMAALALISIAVFIRFKWYRFENVELIKPDSHWFFILFIVAAALLFAQQLGGALASAVVDVSADASPDDKLYVGTVTRFIVYSAAIPVLVVAWICIRKAWQEMEKNRRIISLPKLFLLSLLTLLLIYPVLSTGGELARITYELISDTASNPIAHETLNTLQNSTSQKWKWISSCLVVIGAPVIEETLYRGLLQQSFKSLIGSRWFSIFFVSVIFTLMHLAIVTEGGKFALVSLFVLSVGLGFIYEKTQSLLAPIMVHALFNLLNLIMLFSGLAGG